MHTGMYVELDLRRARTFTDWHAALARCWRSTVEGETKVLMLEGLEFVVDSF